MTITIHDTKTNTTASIDSFGAQLVSLKDGTGKEYIWQRDPDIWPRCSPLLFPVVGNCRNGRTRIDGVWYQMEKHGFCKESDFTVTGKTSSSCCFQLAASDHTRRSYPFDFILTLSYELKDGILLMDYSVMNPKSRDIYYCIGSHPGFICPLEDGETFDEYMLEFEKEEDTRSMPFDLEKQEIDTQKHGIPLARTRVLPLSYELFREDAVYFDQIVSRKVSLLHQKTRRGVEVFYPDFETIAFWTPYGKNASFLCIEPWNGSSIRSDEDDELIHRHHLQTLKPGQTNHYHMEIRVL